MKKVVFLLLLNLLIFSTCRKSISTFPDCGKTVNLNLNTDDTFIFGSTGGFGGGGLGLYKIKNGQLFRILKNRDTLLSNDLFLQTQALMTEFPKELKDNPNQQTLPKCNDSLGFWVEITPANGTKQSWSIDPCGNKDVSSSTQCYLNEIGRLSNVLLKN